MRAASAPSRAMEAQLGYPDGANVAASSSAAWSASKSPATIAGAVLPVIQSRRMHPLGFVPHAASTRTGAAAAGRADDEAAAGNEAAMDGADIEDEPPAGDTNPTELGGSRALPLAFEHPAAPLTPNATDRNQDSVRRIHRAR
jgi:hypothetical protein